LKYKDFLGSNYNQKAGIENNHNQKNGLLFVVAVNLEIQKFHPQ